LTDPLEKHEVAIIAIADADVNQIWRLLVADVEKTNPRGCDD